jgi:hypothetical protein
MQRSFLVAGILLFSGLVCLRAESKDHSNKPTYEGGTVLSVNQYFPESNYLGSPTDAPLQSEYHGYDVGIRVNCTIYVGRYESALDYIPISLAPNHPVEVFLRKHTLFVRMPELGREVELQMVDHKRMKEDGCATH